MMDEFQYELKIPKERIAVLIGKEGKTKKDIEKATKTTLEIDSNECDIFIKGTDGLNIYTAKEIITAIGRGFNPETALLLLTRLLLPKRPKNTGVGAIGGSYVVGVWGIFGT